MLLAAFASSIMGEDVGVVELNDHGDLVQMEWSLFGTVKSDKEFQYRGIHFYKGVDEREVPTILNEGCSILILDCGATLEQNWREFVRCDVKVAVCSPVEWKSMELNRFLQRNGSLYGVHSWNYWMPFGNERVRKCLKKERGIHSELITYESNPFSPSQKNIMLFHKTLNG